MSDSSATIGKSDSVQARAETALTRLAGVAGVAVHDGDAILEQLVIQAEDVAHRLETTAVASDFAILKAEGVKLAAQIGLLVSLGKPAAMAKQESGPAKPDSPGGGYQQDSTG